MARYPSEKYSEDDPVIMLANARKDVRRLKSNNRELSDQSGLILKNNSKFGELVLILQRKVRALTEEQAKIYKYSYGRGWMEKDSADPKKLKIVKPNISIQEINSQLEEILRLIRVHTPKE